LLGRVDFPALFAAKQKRGEFAGLLSESDVVSL